MDKSKIFEKKAVQGMDQFEMSGFKRTYHTLLGVIESSMDEYAQQQSIAFAKWVMNNCHQDIGNPDEERWCYQPQEADEYVEKTSAELYELFLKSQNKP